MVLKIANSLMIFKIAADLVVILVKRRAEHIFGNMKTDYTS